MKKHLEVIAEYFVFLEGIILFVCAGEIKNLAQGLTFLIASVMLLLLSLGINKILKRLINKTRTETNMNIVRSAHAFPSGHATGLGAMTTIIIMKSSFLGFLSLLLSLIILFARVKLKIHDLSDITAGFFLGGVCALIFMPYLIQFVLVGFLPYFVDVLNF